MEQQSFGQIFSDLGQAIGHPGLNLDEQGECLLSTGRQAVFIRCPEGAEAALLYAPVGEPTEGPGRPALMEELLAANTYNARTQGLTLGLSDDRDLIILSALLPVRLLNAAALEAFIHFFLEQALWWEQYIDDYPRSEQEEALNPAILDGVRV